MCFADVLAGVDVDRYQRFRLVDHDVSAGLQPYLRLHGIVDLVLDTEVLEQRSGFGVQLDAPHQRGLETLRKPHNPLVLFFRIDPDLRKIGVHLVAQHALHQVQVVIDQGRRLAVLCAVLDLSPQMFKETNVGAQFVFLDIGRCRSNDEAAQSVLALAGNDALETLALFFRIDLARHTDVIHRRHVHQEPPRQRDMAGNARPFLGDRLFSNLDEDLLPFFQQVGNQRLRAMRVGAQIVAATTTTALAAAIVACALNLPLLVGGSGSGRSQLRAFVSFFVVLLFAIFVAAANQSRFAAFLGCDDFVFVDIGNLRNPAVGVRIAIV